MSEQSEEVRNYLRAKYQRYRQTPQQKELLEVFDPEINPDEGYIPYCAACEEDFADYKKNMGDECLMDHTSACLWFDYFTDKIRKLNPKVKIRTDYENVKKKTKDTNVKTKKKT